jgi:Leucine-rich repeat (LRR) protein
MKNLSNKNLIHIPHISKLTYAIDAKSNKLIEADLSQYKNLEIADFSNNPL